MTFADLYAQVKFSGGDEGGDYTEAARRWLNFARSDINDACTWKNAFDPKASFTTSAATTDGIYELSGYRHVAGMYLWDQTTESNIAHESIAIARSFDPAQDVTGPPIVWGDAGADDTDGNRYIYLWPIPDDTRTIDFHGIRGIADVTEAMDNLTLDAFFGPIIEWQATFAAGMKYYQDLDNNEGVAQIMGQRGVFKSKIKDRMKKNRLSASSLTHLRNTLRNRVPYGRLDPAHFDNT